MFSILKNSKEIGCLIQSKTVDIGTGMPWDDSPDNIITQQSFNQSGLFLTDAEAMTVSTLLKEYYNYETGVAKFSVNSRDRSPRALVLKKLNDALYSNGY